ncbi:MAG: tryptophan--tRNA ligase [Deltaproteobacteria bacterium]|nr:tryptophan--tRNA ligase [Deltaproteobacteria bacterium]
MRGFPAPGPGLLPSRSSPSPRPVTGLLVLPGPPPLAYAESLNRFFIHPFTRAASPMTTPVESTPAAEPSKGYPAQARRTLSGIKPSGTPHLGNYLGFLRPALEMQATHQSFYFIADYHALTSVRDAPALRESTLDLAAVFHALGMDFDRHTFFRQSDVPEVTELAWILSCITPLGLLHQAHAYKDKTAKGEEINHGLFAYPVLMAADILIYDSTHVPVGKDQKQHLEITRDIAQRFNFLYGDTLVIPEPTIAEDVATVPGLDGRKMSKSYGNVIPLFGDPKQTRKTVMKIVTDSKGVEEPKDPDACNVFALYKHFARPEEQAHWAGRYKAGGMGYGEIKQALFDAMERELAAPRERYQAARQNTPLLEGILEKGAEKARKVAREVLGRVKQKVGLG